MLRLNAPRGAGSRYERGRIPEDAKARLYCYDQSVANEASVEGPLAYPPLPLLYAFAGPTHY